MAGHVKRMVIFMAVVTLGLFASCGGSSSALPTTPATVPVSIESLVGATDIAVDASFQLEFDKDVDCSTVTSSTFYIVLASSGCDPSAALSASIDCDSTQATLDPTNDLTGGTSYSICATTGITYEDGTTYSGVTAAFTTAGTNGVSTLSVQTCSSSLECGSDEYCYFDTCESYEDVGIETTVNCTSGPAGTDICDTTYGLPDGYNKGEYWGCLPIATSSATCEFYCVNIPTVYARGDYPSTETECDNTDNAVWVDSGSGNTCIPSESAICYEDSGGATFAIINGAHTNPPAWSGWVGISDAEGDWPLSLTDVATCNQEILRVSVYGMTTCEENKCIGISRSSTSSYGLMTASSTSSDASAGADIYVYLTTAQLISELNSIGASSGDTIYFNYWWNFVSGVPQDGGASPWDMRVFFTSDLCD